MKKLTLLALAALATVAASAQTQLVKDVEHQLKSSSPDYKKAYNDIQPALTNPETKDDVQAWFLAGKAGFGIYDDANIQINLGNDIGNEGKRNAGNALINSFNYYLAALPLDSVPNEKGKIKPKYSKEICNTIKTEHPFLHNAGIYLLQAGDYKGANDAWELYLTLPDNPVIPVKMRPAQLPDTIQGQIMYYQVMALLSTNDNEKALAKLKKIPSTGFENSDIYAFGVEAARRMNDNAAVLDFANKGFEKYGTENIVFVGEIINDKLINKDYASCYSLVEQALAATQDPAIKSQLYDVLGNVYDQDDKYAEAVANFEKSLEIDPNSAKANFDLARMIYNDALKKDEAADNAVCSPELVEQFLRSAELFEKAYNLDEAQMGQVPNILYRLYYRLGDQYKAQMKAWEGL